MADSRNSMVPTDRLSDAGQTRRFGVQGLRVEITDVLSAHRTCMLAEGVELCEYVVVACAPGAKLTILNADMSDPADSEDGASYPRWGLSYDGEVERTRITDETPVIPVTRELEGIYHLEASQFVIWLDLVD